MIKFRRDITFPKDTSYQEWLRYIVQCCEPATPELYFLLNAWHTSTNIGVDDDLEVQIRPYLDLACLFINEVIEESEEDFKYYMAKKESDRNSNVIYFDRRESNDK